jgi:hypothetical protein
LLALIVPGSAWGAGLALGTARGIRAAELSLDDGVNWLLLGPRSLPILEGTQVRTTNGGAIIDLSGAGRVNVMPFTTLRIREGATGPHVEITQGRIDFRLPREARVEISGPAVRLTPVPATAMRGEFFVTREGTAGLKMVEGSVQVHELTGMQHVRLASLEPVFVPRRPPTTAPLFTSEAPSSAPIGARAVFDPKGESLGYLRPDAQLVVQPGYTANLTQSFPPRLVQFAMAKIDEKNRADAVPVFDVNGAYLGYLAGPVFFAQAQIAPGQATDAQMAPGQISPAQVSAGQVAQAQIAQGMIAPAVAGGAFLGVNSAALGTAVGSIAVVGGVSGAGAAGAFGHAATPTSPIR